MSVLVNALRRGHLATTTSSYQFVKVFEPIFLSNNSLLQQTRLATKKAGGSTKNGRDSNPKYLGVKKFGGHKVVSGNIIIRQRGQKYKPGSNTGLGKDHTIYALSPGFVKFTYCYQRRRQVVSVVSESPYKNQIKKEEPSAVINNSIL